MFSKIDTSYQLFIQHGRRGTIEIRGSAPLQSTVQERRVVVSCRLRPDPQTVELPTTIQVMLFKPQSWIENPLLPGAIPTEPILGTEVIRVPTGQTGAADHTQTRLWREWVSEYWTLVPGVDANLSGATYQEELDNDSWPGNRRSHYFHVGGGTLYPVDGWPLRVATTLNEYEQYLLLLVQVRRLSRTGQNAYVVRVRGSVTHAGDFQLGWVPTAIVYDPPGQDMSNSLIENTHHGTRITLGESTTVIEESFSQTQSGFGFDWWAASMRAEFKHENSNGETVTEATSRVMEITGTQETVVTANNQRAIGRAYWGPLSDIFVILAGPWLGIGKIFNDRTNEGMPPILGIGPSNRTSGTRKLIAPTHVLLQPNDDHVVENIPWEERKRMLLLNPFVVRDEAVLDAVNAGNRPLEDAVNPWANPLANSPTRAVPIVSLNLSQGTELNYYESSSLRLEEIESESLTYSTLVIDSAGATAGTITGSISFQIGNRFSVNYQTTAELAQTNAFTQTAKCYLIRNQNDVGFREIDIYYDTKFGTFMFVRHPIIIDVILISGVLVNFSFEAVHYEAVRIYSVSGRGRKKIVVESATNSRGEFSFPNIPKGKYVIEGGGASKKIEITNKVIIQKKDVVVDIKGARKSLSAKSLRIADAKKVFEISDGEVREFGRILRKIKNKKGLYSAVGFGKEDVKRFEKCYRLIDLK